jgi:integration host factor subunit beta
MNKSDLIKILGENQKITDKEAGQVVDLVFESFSDAIEKGDRVEIRGFGVFTVREYDSYTGRNPKTGEKLFIKRKKLPYFKVGKELKERVNLV